MLVADRIPEADHLLDPAQFAQRRVAHGDLHAGVPQALHRGLELQLAARFPADIGQPVGLAGMEGKAMPAVVDAEVQRFGVRLRRGADLEAQYLGAIASPFVQPGRLEAEIANADDVHVVS
ncbi:hypothetical protein OMK73_08085 [Cupriavidus sp. D39]|nr:hypothetical protein [Cupriavidus sp. D39]MCY0853764.1 hypothetical protein [Cupriavidus sp. D39]